MASWLHRRATSGAWSLLGSRTKPPIVYYTSPRAYIACFSCDFETIGLPWGPDWDSVFAVSSSKIPIATPVMRRFSRVSTLSLATGKRSPRKRPLAEEPQAGRRFGSFRNSGYLIFCGPYNKDPTICGTMLWSPIFGNSHLVVGESFRERRGLNEPASHTVGA